MADIEITVDGGTSKRLLTGGKYCDKNILVTATGGGAEPEPPDDGKTRLYISIPAYLPSETVPVIDEIPLYFRQTIDRGVTIDWGDNTEQETVQGTGSVNTSHSYQKSGEYIITLAPSDGCELQLGANNPLLGSDNAVINTLLKVFVGKGLTSLYIGCFTEYRALHQVYLPDSVTSIPDRAFMYCQGLSKLIVKGNLVKLGVAALKECTTLTEIPIPSQKDGLSKESYAFCRCIKTLRFPNGIETIPIRLAVSSYSITKLTIPDSVTSIGDWAFAGIFGFKELRVLPTTPPTIGAYTFNQLPSGCAIYVPVGSLESYKTATNWSVYADQMQEEPA